MDSSIILGIFHLIYFKVPQIKFYITKNVALKLVRGRQDAK